MLARIERFDRARERRRACQDGVQPLVVAVCEAVAPTNPAEPVVRPRVNSEGPPAKEPSVPLAVVALAVCVSLRLPLARALQWFAGYYNPSITSSMTSYCSRRPTASATVTVPA